MIAFSLFEGRNASGGLLSCSGKKVGKEPARGGRFRISPPSGLPSFKRPKGVIPLLEIPAETCQRLRLGSFVRQGRNAKRREVCQYCGKSNLSLSPRLKESDFWGIILLENYLMKNFILFPFRIFYSSAAFMYFFFLRSNAGIVPSKTSTTCLLITGFSIEPDSYSM